MSRHQFYPERRVWRGAFNTFDPTDCYDSCKTHYIARTAIRRALWGSGA